MSANLQPYGLGLQTLLDYDGRTDGQPVYVGIANERVPEGSGLWLLMKLTYDANDQLTSKKVSRESNWTNRATAIYR